MFTALDPTVDPTTGLRKAVISSLQPSDPGAPVGGTAPTDPAPFASTANTGTQPAPPVSAAPSTASTSFTNTSTATPPPAPYAPGGGQVDQPGVDYSQSGPNFNASAWVTSALNQAKSTDDPNYWSAKIGNDPNVQNPATRDSALAYWQQRINEGDGNGLGNPTLPPEVQPSTSGSLVAAPPPSGSTSTDSTGSSSFDAYLQSLQAAQAARDAQQAKLREIIMARIAADSQPVNEADQNIAAPLSAARDEASRSQDAERTALAERLYAQGGGAINSNALTSQIAQSSEKNAGSLSQLRAGLISQEYTARRNEISTLLSQAMAQGDAQSAQQLQAELAALDAQLKETGMGIGVSEFGAQLNQNAALAGLNG